MEELNLNNEMRNSEPLEWEQNSYSWEVMQPGIFERIETEAPDFFKEKPAKRRFGFWLFAGVTSFLIISISLTMLFHSDFTISNKYPTVLKESTPNFFKKNQTAKTSNIETILSLKDKEQQQSNAQRERFIINNQNIITSSSRKQESSAIQKTSTLNLDRSNSQPLPTLKPQSKTIPPNHIKKKYMSRVLIEQKTTSIKSGTGPELNLQNVPPRNLMHDPSKKQNTNWRLTTSGGAILSFAKYKGDAPAVALRNDHSSAIFGWQYGMRISRSFQNNIGIHIGIDRITTSQSIDITTERPVEVHHENVLLSTTHYIVGNREEKLYGDTTVNGIERNRLVHHNNQRSVMFHSGVSTLFRLKNRIGLRPYAGIALGVLTKSSGKTVLADGTIESYDKSNPKYKKYHQKAILGIDAEFQLSHQFSIIAGYRLDSQLNNSSLESGLTWKPNMHLISFGASYSW